MPDLVVLGQDPRYGGGARAQMDAFLDAARALGRDPALEYVGSAAPLQDEVECAGQDRKIAAYVQGGFAVAGRQQDRQLRPHGLELASQAEAVHFARHHDIGEHQVDAVALDFVQGRFGVGHPADGVAELFKQAGTDLGDIRIVFDQQHTHSAPE